jgi:hypothetical protein
MSATVSKPKFELIDDITPKIAPETQAAPAPKDENAAARNMIMLALRSLSARTVTALTNGFSLILVTLTFISFGRVLDDPTPYKLGGVGGFAIFCLLMDIVRRRAK